MRTNPNYLDDLSNIGWTEKDGRNCLAYSPEENAAFSLAREIMERLGMKVEIDGAGNLYGTWYPKDNFEGRPVVASGSHLDSVYNGGRYDGVLGVAGALEAIRRMQEQGLRPNSPIQVIAFRAEESSRFKKSCLGSAMATGTVELPELTLLRDKNDSSLTLLQAMGVSEVEMIQLLQNPSITRDQIKAYIELHIEQSPVLYVKNQQSKNPYLGVVTGGIGGATRDSLILEGVSSHSGGNPMRGRKGEFTDITVVSAEIITAINKYALKRDKKRTPFRATVNIENIPGKSINAVSGYEKLALDFRGLYESYLMECRQEVFHLIENIARKHGVQCAIKPQSVTRPVTFTDEVPNIIRAEIQNLGLKTLDMPSMPGHDAANIARIGVPTGMIFVESWKGISHHPSENTSSQQVERGIQALTHSLLAAAR